MPRTTALPTAPSRQTGVGKTTSSMSQKSNTKLKAGAEVPIYGPGSTIARSKDAKERYYKKLTFTGDDIHVNFDTNSIPKIPDEVFQNEEVIQSLKYVNLANNKIKKIQCVRVIKMK